VKFADPRRGDIIVFVYPVDRTRTSFKRSRVSLGNTVESEAIT